MPSRLWMTTQTRIVMLTVMLLMTVPALVRKKLSRPQGIALLCIYAAFCVIQFTM